MSVSRKGDSNMVHEMELEEFRGLSLILQHRALVRELDGISRMLDAYQEERLSAADAASQLHPLVRRFTQALPEHFSAESRSTSFLLQDVTDREFERRLRELDGEHPRLQHRFDEVLEQLDSQQGHADSAQLVASFARIAHALGQAIEAFRKHEAAEDALFAD